MPLTFEQFQNLRAKGLTPQQIAKFEAGAKPRESNTFLNNVGSFLKGAGKGFLKTSAKSLEGLERFGSKISGIPVSPRGTLAEQNAPERFYQTRNSAEKAGFATEQIAEFLAPIPGSKVQKGASLAQRAVREGAEFAGRTAVQEGEINTDVATAGVLGGSFPIVGRALTSLGRFIRKAVGDTARSVSSAMTSVPEKAISEAIRRPSLAKKGFQENVTAATIREEAIAGYKNISSVLNKSFKEGIEEMAKLSPRRGVSRTSTGQFSAVKSQMKNFLDTKVGSLKGVLNEFRISTRGDKLDFNRLNSAIVSPTEQKQIQRVFDTLRKQKDFSAKGVNDVATRINSLIKFQDGNNTKSSVVVGKIRKAYEDAMEKVYPDLIKLRKEYGTTRGVLDAANEILRVGTKNPRKMEGSIGILTNIYKTDKDAYFKALKDLEEAAGIKFMSKLAGTEFQKISPSILRTSLAVGGATGLALGFQNPLALALLPLFSPRAVGGLITNASQAKLLMEELLRMGMPKLGEKQISAIVNRLITLQE